MTKIAGLAVVALAVRQGIEVRAVDARKLGLFSTP